MWLPEIPNLKFLCETEPACNAKHFGPYGFDIGRFYVVYDMIFIYCNWVSTRWKRSVDLYKNSKDTAQKEKQYTKQHKNTEYTKYKTNIQNKKTNIKRI